MSGDVFVNIALKSDGFDGSGNGLPAHGLFGALSQYGVSASGKDKGRVAVSAPIPSQCIESVLR